MIHNGSDGTQYQFFSLWCTFQNYAIKVNQMISCMSKIDNVQWRWSEWRWLKKWRLWLIALFWVQFQMCFIFRLQTFEIKKKLLQSEGKVAQHLWGVSFLEFIGLFAILFSHTFFIYLYNVQWSWEDKQLRNNN